MNNDRNEHSPQGGSSGGSGDCPATGSAPWGPDDDWYASHAWCGIYPECCPGYDNYFGRLLCPWTRIVTSSARYKRAVLIEPLSGTYTFVDDLAAAFGEPQRPSDILDAFAYAFTQSMQEPVQRMVPEPAKGDLPRYADAIAVAPPIAWTKPDIGTYYERRD